jgi:hypothetical protein
VIIDRSGRFGNESREGRGEDFAFAFAFALLLLELNLGMGVVEIPYYACVRLASRGSTFQKELRASSSKVVRPAVVRWYQCEIS